jgi:endonuclease/exonuclease/phosphatase family metal-dependent hydrolase
VTRFKTMFAAVLLTLAAVPTGVIAQSLPAGWATRDIGSVGAAGSAYGSGGTFTAHGAGADIWDTSDQFRFVYVPMTGDGTIVSQVVSVQYVHAWTKAGVMMRETLLSTSRHASMLVTPAKGLAFQRRTTVNGVSTSTAGGVGTAPYYVRLVRSGSVFTASKSLDGVTWTVVGSETMNMASTIYVGVVISSHVTGVLATAQFGQTAVTSGAATAPATVTQPPPPPPPSGMTKLRFLHWNVRHGGTRTDGVYDPNGLTNWIVSWNPDVISLNEIDNSTQGTTILNYLKTKTGANWVSKYDGRGNMVLSKLSRTTDSVCVTNASVGRKAAHLSVLVNGRPLNVWSGHFALDSSAVRTAEAVALQACEALYPEARLVGMDFNAQPYSAEYNSMLKGHTDAWVSAPVKTNYAGNCDGCTRNSRIDYIWTSRTASYLTLASVQIFDTRNASGVMASDHKPMLVVYNVAP